jgi:hypothetical protein
MSAFYQLLADMPAPEQESQEQQGEQQVEQQVESQEFDLSAFEHLPDGWKPKERFATSEQELQFYREKYPALWQHISSDQFLDQFLNTYEHQIASKEQEVKSVTQLIKALNSNPEEFIAAYLPEYAEKLGVGRIFSSDEIGDYVESKIAEEFGENWRDVYNPADLVRRNSVSSQILKRTQALESAIENHNDKVRVNRDKFLQGLGTQQQQQAPTQFNEKQLDSILDTMIDGYFTELKDTGLSEDEFIELAIQSFQHQPTMRDIYRIMHHDKIIEQERQRAYEEGRKSMLSEFKKGSKRAAMDYVPAETPIQEYKQKSFMGLRLGDGI